jgi:hypothetical protein
MNGIEKSNRRVEMSAVLSDAVYEYEKAYTSGQKDPTLKADDVLKEAVSIQRVMKSSTPCTIKILVLPQLRLKTN